MIAFAGNSIICRLALRDAAIDPASFTSIRLTSGALTLIAIVLVLGPGSRLRQHGSWQSAITLFVYAISFSYAENGDREKLGFTSLLILNFSGIPNRISAG